MIGGLKGIVEHREDDHLVLDVHGVGYTVFASSRLLASLAEGDAVRLVIETQVREDHIHLFGFETHAEREWFRLLTSVQRVGAKMALSLLSAMPPERLLQAILARDTSAFSRISGVGPKLAERIVTELKDKAAQTPTGGFAPLPATHAKSRAAIPAEDDAISALVNLGYSRSDAFTAAQKARQEAGETASLDQLIRLSLKELA